MARFVPLPALLALACSAPMAIGRDAVTDPGPAAPDAQVADPGDADPGAGPDAADAPADPVVCRAPAAPDDAWWRRAVGYEIFVRSFQDSDGNGVGDFAGMTSRLDALNDGNPATDTDLGVDLVWLMPITASPSYHGYDVTDYRRVNPDYGSEADLDAFLAAAHQRGIRVVMDLVLNHSSDDHPWFLGARSGPAAPLRSRYVWSPTRLDWTRPWDGSGQTWHAANGAYYYGVFSPGMPDLNWTDAALKAEMFDAAKSWLARGLDGFRLDAVRYLVETGPGEGQADTPGTHAVLRDFRQAMAAAKPDAMMVGEVWEANKVVAPYFGTQDAPELHMAFDFDGAKGFLDAIHQGLSSRARTNLCERLNRYPAWGQAGTFLANHDQVRVGTYLEDDGAGALRLAAAMLLTWPGTPWIYYGEEIGMRNGAGSGDEDKRLPMQWTAGTGAGFTTGSPWRAPRDTTAPATVAGQSADPDSLLGLYRKLIRLRAGSPALRAGSTAVLDPGGPVTRPVFLLRERDGESVLLVFNVADEGVGAVLPAAALPAATAWKDLVSGIEAKRASAGAPLDLGTIEPRGFRILRAL